MLKAEVQDISDLKQLDSEMIRVDPTSSSLGRGRFSVAYRGTFCGKLVAVKKSIGQGSQKELMREVRLLHGLDHPNIVKLHGVCEKYDAKVCVMELCEKGSLDKVLHAFDEDPGTRLQMALDCCHGISFLHQKLIYHGDLKLANILVNVRNECKLSDFNLSKKLDYEEETFQQRGYTRVYAAPELRERDHASLAADVYSFGVCLFELLTLQCYAKLITGMGGGAMLKQLQTGRMLMKLDGWPPPFKPAQQLVDECLAHDPLQRPVAAGILAQIGDLHSMPQKPTSTLDADSLIPDCMQRRSFIICPAIHLKGLRQTGDSLLAVLF